MEALLGWQRYELTIVGREYTDKVKSSQVLRSLSTHNWSPSDKKVSSYFPVQLYYVD